MLPHPASPPFPPRPGRFPGRRCAAEHSHHPAAASPALHPGVRCLPLRTDAGHDLLRGLVPDGGCLRVRSLPHRPRLESLARGSSAGEERVPGERMAGAALHPGLAGAGTHAPGTADRPWHLPDRHRAKTHRARRAVERQPLARDLQPLLLQYIGRKDVGLEGKIVFFLYLLLVLSCCTLLYRRVKLWCRRNAAAPLLTLEKDGFAGRSIRSVSKVSHYFQLVFLLCWAPAFLLTLLSFTSIKPASVFFLYVATALTVSLQGFLHSLVYGWLRQNFRQEAVGTRPSLQHHRGLKAFYDESLGAVP
ncbi:uncharacterized protein LOC115341765 isoform X4 [Aquila chrysaetos chrysaetos]|uniref:uncharacterized protein LOC115341765 isoform X4 n=1 Tax=Aquila chrysaetos chrysaetos TaxID=223781 RepID=UPI001B7D3B62|nr:uncharacterized protein LOC115341765 isoform X4 [Aquila chrysaetos chrysaetos]